MEDASMNAWTWRTRLGVTALALTLLSFAAPAGRAAAPALAPTKDEDAKKLAQLAKDLEANGVNVPHWLRATVGFAPDLDGFPAEAHVYFDLPDVVKLRAAYQAIENAKADSGAVLLDLLGKRLELEKLDKKGDKLTDEERAAGVKIAEQMLELLKKLNPDFKVNDVRTLQIKFVFKPAPERPKLADEDRNRLAVLAQYLEQSRNGGPVAALKRYFSLDADAAHLLLWESGTCQLAFERAFAEKQTKEPKFLEQLVARVNEDALKHKDRTLERTALLWPKAPQRQPGDDELPALTPPRGPKFPDAPKAVRGAGQRAEDYRKDNAEAASLKPADVRKTVGNPTGIFFAAEARADNALPKPAALEYTPGAGAADGKLTVTFANDTKRTLAPVHAEDARVAFEMIYGANAAKPGDGVPLLVLDGPHSYFEVKDGKLLRGRRREVTLHPALLDRELALACVRIDGLPRSRQWLLDEIDADPAWGRFDKDEAARRKQALRQTADWVFDPWTNLARKFGPHSSVFRLTDVPLLIRGGDGVLAVERDDPSGRWGEPLRRSTFIEADLIIQKYSDLGRKAGEVKRPANYQAEAYQLMAELVPTSAELQRLNNFAAVLAVVRWAKAGEAKFAAPPKPKDGPRTPEAVAVYPDKVVPLPGGSRDEVLKRETGKLDAALKDLADKDAIKKLQTLCAKVIEAIEAEDKDTLEKLAKEVTELERTSAEVRLYQELVEAKYAEILTINHSTPPGKRPDLKVEERRLKPLVEKLTALAEESPAEYLLGTNLVTRFLKRLEDQTKID
jgi:hypothetical protein